LDLTATAETATVHLIGFHPTKTHLDGAKYYADKLVFSICLHTAVILTLCTLMDQLCLVSLTVVKMGNENHLRAL